NMVKDFLDTITPMYGGMQITTPFDFQINDWPQTVSFDTAIASFPPEWEVDAPGGVLSRKKPPTVPAIVSRLTLIGNVEGVQEVLTFQLYKNDQPTPWKINVSPRGAGIPMAIALQAIDYSMTDAMYDLRMNSKGTAANNFLLTNMFLLG